MKIRLLIWSRGYGGMYKLIQAQAKHESANFTSKLYKDQNNVFGMKNGTTLGLGEYKGRKASDGGTYAGYSSVYYSYIDLLNWLERNNISKEIKSPEGYALALKTKNYYGDSLINYTQGLKSWL